MSVIYICTVQENAIVIQKRDDVKTIKQGAKGGHQALQQLIALVNETMVSFQRDFPALVQSTLTHRKDGSVTKELRAWQEREPDNFDKLYDDGDERPESKKDRLEEKEQVLQENIEELMDAIKHSPIFGDGSTINETD